MGDIFISYKNRAKKVSTNLPMITYKQRKKTINFSSPQVQGTNYNLICCSNEL